MAEVALIQDLGLVIGAAATAAFACHRLKQPVAVGYILAGIAIGPHSMLPQRISHQPEISLWAELGVIFLMFHLGLEFSFRRFQRLGVSTLFTGVFEVSAMLALGWLAASMLGYPAKDRWFLAAMLAISSTTIIIKTFEELGLKARRFAERVTGLLLFEDLAAILILVALGANQANRSIDGSSLFALGGELVVVVAGWYLIGTFLVPRLSRRIGEADNDELLVLFALALCLGLSIAASEFKYSMALGAFIMGSILTESREAERIGRLVKPLRSLFAAVFFVSIGMLADVSSLTEHSVTIVLLAALLIVGKFTSVTLGSLFAGQDVRASVQAGFTMGQIGEFSFIIAALGLASGQMSPELQSIVVAVSILTTLTTPYLVRLGDPLSGWVERNLPPAAFARFGRYQNALLLLRDGRALPRWLVAGLGRLALNAVMVALVFGAIARWVSPWMQALLRDPLIAQAVGFFAALAVSGPFLYAMLTAARRRSIDRGQAVERPVEAAARVFVFVGFTVLWVGGLSLQFVSAWASASITLTLGLFVAFLSYQRLERSYSWLESRFLEGLKAPAKESRTDRARRELAPWEAHLVSLFVHPNSSVAGRKLAQSGLRSTFGLTAVAIRRGERSIAMPGPGETLYPGDELLVLGTDEEIEAARDDVEKARREFDGGTEVSEYAMRPFLLRSDAPLARQTIGSCGLRAKFHCLIVGLERDGRRILNPGAEVTLLPGDRLWLVGRKDSLDEVGTLLS